MAQDGGFQKVGKEREGLNCTCIILVIPYHYHESTQRCLSRTRDSRLDHGDDKEVPWACVRRALPFMPMAPLAVCWLRSKAIPARNYLVEALAREIRQRIRLLDPSTTTPASQPASARSR